MKFHNFMEIYEIFRWVGRSVRRKESLCTLRRSFVMKQQRVVVTKSLRDATLVDLLNDCVSNDPGHGSEVVETLFWNRTCKHCLRVHSDYAVQVPGCNPW